MTAVASPPARSLSTRARWWRDNAVWLVPLAGYTLFVLLGLTTSSIGVSYLRADPNNRLGLEIGSPQPYRSDEWETESALTLGQMAQGSADFGNPLSVSPDYFSQLPSGPISSVTFFDGSLLHLGPILPDQMLFAMRWWLPALLLVIFAPLWFRRVTGSLSWGYLATAMILFAPSTMWWSMRPVNTLGFMFAGGFLTLVACERWADRRRLSAVALIVLAAILFARFPSYYQPLAIIVGFPVVLATAAYVLALPGRLRPRIVSLLLVGGVSVLLTAGTAWESLSSIRTGLGTVYPGDRVTTGEMNPLGKVFGATTMGWLGSMNGDAPVTNSVEVASAFTVLLPVLVVLAVVGMRRWQGTRPHLVAFIVMAVCGLVWVAWCTVDWGALGTKIPLMNRVPSYRGANASGFPVAMAFCLFMAQWRPPRSPVTALVSGGVAGLVTGLAGLQLSTDLLPGLSRKMILLAAVITALAVAALVQWPKSPLALVLSTLAMISLVYRVNPIEIGLADLRTSAPAESFLAAGETARENGTLWATDDRWTDALLTAEGTPSLSGRQQIGPVVEQWEKLDPGQVHRDLWNRGGTHIEFDWTDSPAIEWDQSFVDVVTMKMSPCQLKQIFPQLDHVVSSHPLSQSCLAPESTFTWAGQPRYVYQVN